MLFETIDIDYEVLESAVEADAATDNGTRKLNLDIVNERTFGDIVLSIFGDFVGFLWAGIRSLTNAFSFTATFIWTIASQSLLRLASIDWGASDEQLQSILSGSASAAGSILGDFLGSIGVRLGALILVGGASIKFPLLGGTVFAALLEDTAGEVSARVASLLYGLAFIAADSLIYGSILVGRWALRRFNSDIPSGSERLTENNASFYNLIERFTESFDNAFLRNLVESSIDSALDEFIEIGFVIAGGIDEFYATQRNNGRASTMGPERKVRITPDERVPSEQLVIAGPQDLVIQNIEQVTLTHALMWDRDIGAFVGEATEDYVKRSPQALRIQIQFRSTQTPPWRDDDGLRARSVTYTIPNVRRAALDWQTIKQACGGSSGYTWGPFRATAKLTTGSQMGVYGGSANEAETRLRQLLTLSDDQIVTLSVSEEKTEGMRAANPTLIKRPTQVYPAYFTILNREDLLISSNAATDRIQTRSAARARIPLWMNEEPRNASRTIQELLRRGTTRSQ